MFSDTTNEEFTDAVNLTLHSIEDRLEAGDLEDAHLDLSYSVS